MSLVEKVGKGHYVFKSFAKEMQKQALKVIAMNQKHYVHHGYGDAGYEDGICWTSTSGPFANFADASSFAANSSNKHGGIERVRIDTNETHPENKKREKDAA